MSNKHLVWIDLETTGLYGKSELTDIGERVHLILEFAMIITDYDLNPIEQLHMVVNHDIDYVRSLMNDYVAEMHTDNGLLDEIENGLGFSLYHIETKALEVINRVCDENEKPYLVGNSVHFDRIFMGVQMPRIIERLRYRNLDATSVAEFYEVLTGSPVTYPKSKNESHRAINDINECIDQMRHFTKIMKGVDSPFKERLSLLL